MGLHLRATLRSAKGSDAEIEEEIEATDRGREHKVAAAPVLQEAQSQRLELTTLAAAI